MKAIKFPEVNVMIAEHQPEYATLPSYFNKRTGLIVNCFELNEQDIEKIVTYKKLWIHHFTNGSLQPFNIVAVNDYFSSVIHKDGKFTVETQEEAIDEEIENLVNKDNITTPMQSLFVHMVKEHKINLSDAQLMEIVKISKEI